MLKYTTATMYAQKGQTPLAKGGHVFIRSPLVDSPPTKGMKVANMRNVVDHLGHGRRYQVDSGKIHAELGWEPSVPIRAGVDSTVEWYMANGSWGVA